MSNLDTEVDILTVLTKHIREIIQARDNSTACVEGIVLSLVRGSIQDMEDLQQPGSRLSRPSENAILDARSTFWPALFTQRLTSMKPRRISTEASFIVNQNFTTITSYIVSMAPPMVQKDCLRSQIFSAKVWRLKVTTLSMFSKSLVDGP